MIYKFFDKNLKGSGNNNNNNNKDNNNNNNNNNNKKLKLAKELHKPIIKNFKKKQSILDLKTIFGVLV